MVRKSALRRIVNLNGFLAVVCFLALPLADPAAAESALETIESPARNHVGRCSRFAARPTLGVEAEVGVGLGVLDTPRAVDACRAAVAAYPKNSRLHFQLGRAHFAAQQYRQAMAPLEAAIDLGSTSAMELLSAVYERGLGVPHDLPRAARLNARSAQTGSPEGLLRTAADHEYAIGVAFDLNKAFKFYAAAAENGHAN